MDLIQFNFNNYYGHMVYWRVCYVSTALVLAA